MCSHDDDDGDDGLVVSFFVVFDDGPVKSTNLVVSEEMVMMI